MLLSIPARARTSHISYLLDLVLTDNAITKDITRTSPLSNSEGP